MCEYFEGLLKKHFPSYRVNNASERKWNEIDKIKDLCLEIDNLIVFIFRTSKNEDYFKSIEDAIFT